MSDTKSEIYLLGDLNIDWQANNCPMKKKLLSVATACNMSQMVSAPTRIFTNRMGHSSSSCIDHIYTNTPEHCCSAISVPLGFTDHNLVAISRKTKIPKSGTNVVFKRSLKHFSDSCFLDECQHIDLSDVYTENDPEMALDLFQNIFMKIVNKNAPLRKFTCKSKTAPWIDDHLKGLMKQRDEAKNISVKSGILDHRLKYCELRNKVTKLNKTKKREHYRKRICDVKYDGKKLWNVLNEIMGRKKNVCASFVESDGNFLTKPHDIANYFNKVFVSKVIRDQSLTSSHVAGLSTI